MKKWLNPLGNLKAGYTKHFKYKLCLHKAYFEKGENLIRFVKYLIAFFGLASQNVKLTLIIGIIYGLVSYIIGVLWYKLGFIREEIEVSNTFNYFVKEVRKKLKTKGLNRKAT